MPFPPLFPSSLVSALLDLFLPDINAMMKNRTEPKIAVKIAVKFFNQASCPPSGFGCSSTTGGATGGATGRDTGGATGAGTGALKIGAGDGFIVKLGAGVTGEFVGAVLELGAAVGTGVAICQSKEKQKAIAADCRREYFMMLKVDDANTVKYSYYSVQLVGPQSFGRKVRRNQCEENLTWLGVIRKGKVSSVIENLLDFSLS